MTLFVRLVVAGCNVSWMDFPQHSNQTPTLRNALTYTRTVLGLWASGALSIMNRVERMGRWRAEDDLCVLLTSVSSPSSSWQCLACEVPNGNTPTEISTPAFVHACTIAHSVGRLHTVRQLVQRLMTRFSWRNGCHYPGLIWRGSLPAQPPVSPRCYSHTAAIHILTDLFRACISLYLIHLEDTSIISLAGKNIIIMKKTWCTQCRCWDGRSKTPRHLCRYSPNITGAHNGRHKWIYLQSLWSHLHIFDLCNATKSHLCKDDSVSGDSCPRLS